MMEAFVESGMTFGPFEDASCFRIEKSKLFDRCKGIRSVEFIYRPKKNKLFFIEAKASSPVQRTGNEEQYHRFVDEIMEKFSHSFELYLAGILERKSGHEEMADALKKADYHEDEILFRADHQRPRSPLASAPSGRIQPEDGLSEKNMGRGSPGDE